VLDDFTAAWQRGDTPPAESYLERLDPADISGAIELIYREYCLVEERSAAPDPNDYFRRFPRHRDALERLFWLHRECSSSLLGRWIEAPTDDSRLPAVGDSVGPFVLQRELGRGSFARVFLAEQTNLENRLVVLKVTTRATREPWLLARVRHAHIVEIVSQATVNDGAFQLICMPFWGGATLAAVLAAGRNRMKAPASGCDLLADLDHVAAPEYLSAHRGRPAREILSGLSYQQALAWVAARLAEALDHAFHRGVAHGDVKPSNVLLSADGNPMLLDFNLARDWSAAGSNGDVNDPGGTLAYMAPERLRALLTERAPARAAQSDSPCAGGVPESTPAPAIEREGHARPRDCAPHQADIYALGMVLLEALRGRPPERVAVCDLASSKMRNGCFESAALAYARARTRSARALVHGTKAAGRTIPPSLCVILENCLDPDPLRRYRRGSELAEDLDRWRSYRPLAFATERFCSQVIPRWVRRQRRMLVAAAVSLAVGLSALTLASLRSTQTLKFISQHKLEQLWDDPDLYGFQHLNAAGRFDGRASRTAVSHSEPNDSVVVETAIRAMNAYDLLGPGDWRLRDDVRFLPTADFEDLELWLMEQTYRYCSALQSRSHPADWRRAVDILDRITMLTPARAFLELREKLSAKLGRRARSYVSFAMEREAQSAPERDEPRPIVAEWIDEFLLGVAADCESRAYVVLDPAARGNLIGTKLGNGEASHHPRAFARQKLAQQALQHYEKVLALRPDSYWGHYRAASALYSLGEFDKTAAHMAFCVERRSSNSHLRGRYSACLGYLENYPEALQECDRALAGAPDLPEFSRTRAFIRAWSGQFGGIDEDIQRFEMLSARLPRALWDSEPARLDFQGEPIANHATGVPTALDVARPLETDGVLLEGDRREAEVDTRDLSARVELARLIYRAGEWELALREFTKILFLDPENVGARVCRAISALESGRFDEARNDFDVVFNHPRLTSYILEHPENHIGWFRDAASTYLRAGRVLEARALARRALDLAIQFDQRRGLAHYVLAQASAVAARTDATYLQEAIDQLYHAFLAHPDYYGTRYKADPCFDPVRATIDARLRLKPDPTVEHHRRLVAQRP
jgi:serine/threonine protein kinase/tetratricopeptide (TPR) repeat protein